jgi:hypothetical protein
MLEKADLFSIPDSLLLMVYYICIFLTAEGAFILMS